MSNGSNSKKSDQVGYPDGIDFIPPPSTDKTEIDTVDSFELPDEARLGWHTADIATPIDLYRDGNPYIPKSISELEAEDRAEGARSIYLQRDRVLSEDQIRDEAEKKGVSIIDFIDYCAQNNIKRIEQYQPKDKLESTKNFSSPEQRAKIAKLALSMVDAITILELANRTSENNILEAGVDDSIRKIILSQKALGDKSYDDMDIDDAIAQVKDKLKMAYIMPGTEDSRRLFIAAQKDIIDAYDQEMKESQAVQNTNNNQKNHFKRHGQR